MPYATTHKIRRSARAAKKSAHVEHAINHRPLPKLKIALIALGLMLFAAAPAFAGVAAVNGDPTDSALGALVSIGGLIGLGTVKELRDKRNAKLDELAAIDKKAKDEKRSHTEDEAKLIEDGMTAIEQLDGEIRAAEEAEKRAAKLKGLIDSRRAPASPPPRPADPGHDPDSKDPLLNPDGAGYSLLRAVNCLVDKRAVDGVEGEISQELAKRMGKSPRGFLMPLNLRMNATGIRRGMERRALDTTAAAGALVTQQSATMIDLLTNRMRLFQLGATVLSDLTGTIDIPKKLTRGQAYWLGEGGAPTGSNATIGQIEMNPTTVGAYTDITRRTLARTSMSMEQFTRDDLNQVLALAMDAAGINGTGADNQPLGILQNSDIGTVAIDTNGGPITYAKLVELETQVAIENADVDSMAYLTNARVTGDMKQIERFANTGKTLLNDDGTANGYQVAISNQMPSDLTKGTANGVCSSMIFGDFSTVIVGFWSAVDVMVDPYANATSGGVRIILLQDTQLKTRHAESLQKIVDLTTTV